MKILSNFDTHFATKLYDQYVQTFGAEKVVLVHKSKLLYYVHVVRPLLLWLILFSIALYVVFVQFEAITWLPWVFLGVLGLYLLLIVRKIMRFLIDYKMDFLLVTPREVMKYDQTGLFAREVEKLHTSHIKSVSISKKGMLHSFFDIGSLTFLAEGQAEKGDIIMDSIDAVEATERRIITVLGLDKVS